MANVLNRTTKQYLKSANTPDYPVLDWIINPDISLVQGFPSKYWNISGDTVSLMTQLERDAVDLAETQAERDRIISEIDQLENILRAFAGVITDEINLLRQQHSLPDRTLSQLRTAIRNKLGT